MINVSKEFKEKIEYGRFLLYLTITLADGTVLNLDDSNIWEGGFKIDEGVTESGEFTIGSCVINKMTVVLHDEDEKLSRQVFDGAQVIPYVGIELDNGSIEKIPKGVYEVDSTSYDGDLITLECLDNMHKLDKEYSITKKAVSGGYECTYTPDTALSDGSHTVKVDASDYDGNAAVQKSVTFKIDTVPPTLSITSPVDGLVTNQAACTVKGITNDVTSSPVTVTIKLNSGSAEAVTVGSDGSFSKALTLAAGSNTITIVARDSAGKTTTITRTVKLDTTPPTIKSITLTPNPVDAGKTFVISVEVTD